MCIYMPAKSALTLWVQNLKRESIKVKFESQEKKGNKARWQAEFTIPSGEVYSKALGGGAALGGFGVDGKGLYVNKPGEYWFLQISLAMTVPFAYRLYRVKDPAKIPNYFSSNRWDWPDQPQTKENLDLVDSGEY